jgi:glycosyltransferase involved in cell wall biosynthesis
MVPMKRELQGPLAAQLTALALEVAAPRASAIVTVDNRLGRRLARYGRILVLPNYPRLANFPSVSSSRPDGPPVMLYVGSLTERRGILVMLEALRLLRKSFDVRLMIAGGFYDDNLEQKCHAFDREHDLQVEWLGWVDHRELAGVVSQASLGLSLLQPTERYLKGLPTKIFEYLIMGLPVLSARGPLLDRLIALSAAGLSIDSTSPATVAAGMRELLSRDDLATMASKGQHIARKLFTWDARQGKLPELYARLLQSS